MLIAKAPGPLGDKFREWSALLVESATSAVTRCVEALDRSFDTGDAISVASPLLLAATPGLVALLLVSVAQSSRWITRLLAAGLLALALVSFATLDLADAVVIAVPCTLIAGVSLVLGGTVVQVAVTALGTCLALSCGPQALSRETIDPLATALEQASEFLGPYPALALAAVYGCALLPFVGAALALGHGALGGRVPEPRPS